MNVEELKDVIAIQREEFEEKFGKQRIIGREVDKGSLLKFLEYPNILAILGVRRCGKSIFSWQLFSSRNFAYVNFDDERLLGIGKEDLNRVLQAFYELYGVNLEHIVLDEPQNVIGWELFINRLRRTKKVIVTGSNSQLLSGELATALTGRYISFDLFPFSFREFLRYNEVRFEGFLTTKDISQIKRMLESYMKIGGLPEAYLFGKEIVARIYFDIVEKDVVKRLKVRKKHALNGLSKYLVSNFASEISYRKLSNILEIRDVHTVKNWIDGLKNAYLIFTLERYSPKLKEQMIAPKKVYSIDNGIVTSVGSRASENFGRLMENLAAIELQRRKSYWLKDVEIYYFKDHQQREVDFVVKEGLNVKHLIQVTNASSKDEIERRELEGLKKASDLLRCRDLLVITWDYEDVLRGDGIEIKCMPLWKWLLSLTS